MNDMSKKQDPEREKRASLPNAERQEIAKTIVIDHDRYRDIINFLKRRHKPVDGGVPDYGTIGVVFGDTRSGKTFAQKHYADRYPSVTTEFGLKRPVIYVDTPVDATVRALMEQIAEAIGLPFSSRQNTRGLGAAILRELKLQGIELLIIDELQEIFDLRRKQAMKATQSFLRKILNLRTLNIVVAGLPETYAIIDADKQLKGRGLLPRLIVKPYLWTDDDQRKEFRLLCDCLDDGLPFKQKSRLGTIDMASRLYWVTDGLIGTLTDFVFAAACLAINDHSDAIEMKHLAEAWDERKPIGMSFNPFTDDMALAPSKERAKIETENSNPKRGKRK